MGRASSPGQDAELELRLTAEDDGMQMTISRARLLFPGGGYVSLSVPFYCPRDVPVSLEIQSIRGGASLDNVTLRAALLPAVQPAHPRVSFDAADNVQTSRNTGYGWGELEDWKQPGVVQWALGQRSFLYCLGRNRDNRRLVFRAPGRRPAMLGGNQQSPDGTKAA